MAKVREVISQGITRRGLEIRGTIRVPLTVSIYNVSSKKVAGYGDIDFIYYLSPVFILLQFGVATIPCALYTDWAILMITALGTLLAWATAALPQWRKEKVLACRKQSSKTFVLTPGNLSSEIIVIRGCGLGLDLEDLAQPMVSGLMYTRIAMSVLTILWIAMLITVAGLKQNTWFLLAVGALGTLQNIIVAALPRKPRAYGIHLEHDQTVCKETVMKTLMALEELQTFLGINLLPTFSVREMKEDEIKWWENAKKKARATSE